MSRIAFGCVALIVGLGSAAGAAAHHPPLMERCHSITFDGRVEEIDWINPHVVIGVRTDGGAHFRVTWLTVQQLGWAGIDRDTLRIGDRVTVTAGTRDDVVERPMLLSRIRRTSDGWEWSQLPQGC